MTDTLKKEFRDRMDDIHVGMLGADAARAVPMSHYLDQDADILWFITAKETDLAKAAQTGADAQYVVSSNDAKIHARIDGTLQAVTDPAKLDELWNAIASAWFEDGKRDDDVQLLRMTLSQAEVWITRGGPGFFYQVAKAHLTDAEPDMGDHGTIRF